MADQSDKWHHSMARYLGLSPDTSFSFGIQPGFCREAVGRYDWVYSFTDTFASNQNYFWSEFHYNKVAKTNRLASYFGTSPFLWDLGRTAITVDCKPEGSLFFIPRDDQVTIREDEWETVQQVIDIAPKPITFLVPWRSCDIWKNWDKLVLPDDSELIQMVDRNTRQFILATLFLRHKHVYIPWPGTDVFYAEFLGRNIVVYDKLEKYRTKTDEEKNGNQRVLDHLKWGYDYLNEKQKKFFHYLCEWSELPEQDRLFLTRDFLGLNALKSPEELYHDLYDKNLLPDDNFVNSGEYNEAYLWLMDKTKKFVNIKCSDRCTAMYDII